MNRPAFRPGFAAAAILGMALSTVLAAAAGTAEPAPAVAGAVALQEAQPDAARVGRPAVPDYGSLDVSIVNVEPMVLVEGDTLGVTVQVTNRTNADIEGAGVELAGQGWTPNTRTSLTRWLDPDVYFATIELTTAPLPDLTPGSTAEVRLEVPATDLHFNTWGPRGIEVTSVPPPAEDDGGVGSGSAAVPRADRERSWAIWWNEPAVEPLPFGVLVPVSPTAEELSLGSGWQSRYEAFLAQGTEPGVTLLVDPSPLDFPPTTPEDRGAVAAHLADAHEVWTLPWACADTEALVGAGRAAMVEEFAERSAHELEAIGVTVSGHLDGTIDPTPAAAAATTGPLVLMSDSVAGWSGRGTPSGVVSIDGRQAIVLDEIIRDVLGGATEVDGAVVPLTNSQQRQLLAATTIVTIREDPQRTRPLFASFPIDDDGQDAALVGTVTQLPWISPMTLSDAADYFPGSLAIDGDETLSSSTLPASAVTAGELSEADAIQSRFEVFEEVVADPAAISAPAVDQLDIVAARAWRDAPSERARILASARELVTSLDGRLSIVAPSSVLMISETSNFPVTVVNGLASDATVVVSLESNDRRLQQVDPQTITVAAEGEFRAEIPVTAVGSGDLTIEIALHTPSGTPLGTSLPIEVRMRADWENVGLVTLIALASVFFVFGIAQTVRRNLREDRSAVMEEAVEQFEAQLAAESAAAEARNGHRFGGPAHDDSPEGHSEENHIASEDQRT